jgi:hypothetical protein
VGQYRSDQSNALVNVLLEKGQLQLKVADKKHPLFASSELGFYQEGEFMQVRFDSAITPQQLTLNRFIGVEQFLRVE